MTEHEDWLKLTAEEPKDRELPIIDAHHHIHSNYLLGDFLLDVGGGHNIAKTVFVENWRLYLGTPEAMEPWRENGQLKEDVGVLRRATALSVKETR